jgi:ankyrin repeat protein
VYAKELIDIGANVNYKSKEGQYAIISAAHFGMLNLIKRLIKAGANINVQDINGDTALYAAAAMGYVHIVKHLIECGADMTIKTNQGKDFIDCSQAVMSLSMWLNNTETQRMLFETEPSLYQSYIRNKSCLVIRSQIKKEFPHLGNAADLNLL